MLCDKCKQKEAVVIIQQNLNGNISEYNLCASCAAQTAGGMSFDEIVKSFMNSVMSLGLAPSFDEDLDADADDSPKCPTCGLTYEGFRSGGRLGCSDCYATFKAQLVPLFKNVHGGYVHSGKVPNRTGSDLMRGRRINELRDRLRYLVESEEFEEAAKVRDKIKELSV